MEKENNKVDFDLSVLTLSELITLYERVSGFLKFLSDQKIEEEVKGEE